VRRRDRMGKEGKEMEVHPVPEVGMTRILGLLEVLDDRGGREDIYRLARELSYEFGELLGVIKAAEILGLVHTPGGDVVLQPLGKQIIECDVNTKKSLLKKQVKTHSLFAHFIDFLKSLPGRYASREEVVTEAGRILPQEKPLSVFRTLVNWGRYTELFGYNRDDDKFYLDSEG
jgi:NitT/TauT family transport system ATP-binding protein